MPEWPAAFGITGHDVEQPGLRRKAVTASNVRKWAVPCRNPAASSVVQAGHADRSGGVEEVISPVIVTSPQMQPRQVARQVIQDADNAILAQTSDAQPLDDLMPRIEALLKWYIVSK